MPSEVVDAEPQGTAGSLREAFRHLHGARLHGFALLVSLGDARHAERSAGAALAAGEIRAGALRHPERAAAWIRSQALPMLRGARGPGRLDESERRDALRALGVDGVAFDGLAALGFDDRVALVASAIERFDPLDIEAILGTSPSATRRAIVRARERYLGVVATGSHAGRAAGQGELLAGGELATRVRRVAERTLSGAKGGGPA